MTTARPASVIRQHRPALRRDPNAVVASAAVLTGPARSGAKVETKDWQSQAWQFYDDVGEVRAAVGWKANALSRVNLVAAIVPSTQGDEPTFIDAEDTDALHRRAVELVEQIAGGPAGQGQLLAGLTRLLEVAGVGYVLAPADPATDTFTGAWRSLSNDEVRQTGGKIQVTDPTTGQFTDIGESDLLIKVWRSHPRRSWEADSPVRGCLKVLGEIDVLSKRIMADARSRLTGAGLLLVDSKVEFAPGQGAGTRGPEDADDFLQTLIEVASIAPTDLDGPAANVPLVAKLPTDSVDKVQLLKFWSELSVHAEALRNAAIRRYALGMDMPPDMLLGLADANHWSGWLIADEAVSMHVEPLAELVVHALTIGYLHAALRDEKFKDVERVMVWYDASDLSTRPDLSSAAGEAHSRGVLSDEAYLGYLGLDAGDMPDEDEKRIRTLLAIALSTPQLAAPILTILGYLDPEAAAVLQDAAAQAQDQPAAAPQPPEPAAPVQGPPETPTGPPAAATEPAAPPDQLAADAALLAAADGLVHRALERAGNRLRNALGKGTSSGAAAIAAHADMATMHTVVDAGTSASLTSLLAGAWDRVPAVAARYDVDADGLQACLDAYCRALLAAGHAHDLDRLADALGVTDAGRVVTPA